MSKWFRVATEGATTDGRKISREWIEQMARNFDRTKYGARVWLEHMRGLFADGPFAALGDVLAVKAEEIKEGDLAGKLGLFVQLDPTDQLKEMNSKRQKIYTSIEVDPEFSDTGEAYLVGLGVTDSPASLGTDMLQFSAQQKKASPLATRKQRPDNLFTEAVEVDFSELFAEEEEDDKGPSLMDNIKGLFKRHSDKTKGEFSAFRADLEQTLELFVEKYSALEKALEAAPSTESFNALQTAHDDLKKRFDELYTRLDNDPDTPPRSSATGSEGAPALTDC